MRGVVWMGMVCVLWWCVHMCMAHARFISGPKPLDPPFVSPSKRFDGQDQLVPFKMQAKYAAQPLETLAAASAAATTIGTAAVAVAASEEAAATSTNAGAAAASEKDGASSHSDATSKSTNKPPPPIVEAVPASVDARAKLVTYERYCHVYRCVFCVVFFLFFLGFFGGGWLVCVCVCFGSIMVHGPFVHPLSVAAPPGRRRRRL